MKNTRNKVILIASLIAAVCLGLIVFSSKPKNSNTNVHHESINIVTTTNIYADAAKQIVGSIGNVKIIIDNPHIDPHDFKPTSKTTQLVTNADIVVSNGLGYDNWLDPLIGKQHWLNVGRDVAHKKNGDNPHIWFDYKMMNNYAHYLAQELGKIQPENKKYFISNAKKYSESLQPIYKKVKTIRTIKTNNLVDVSEPLFDYALGNLGYRINNPAFSKAIENESDPSINDAQNVTDDFREHRIAFYVQNVQTDSNTTKNILKEAKKQQVPILYLTETMPTNLSYVNWQLQIYNNLERLINNEK